MTEPREKPTAENRPPDYPTFRALLGTMFQTALSDNIYRFILTMLVVALANTHALRRIGEEKAGTAEAQELATQIGSNYQAIVSGLFILPFALAVALAGWMSDRYSKTKVTRFTKLLEIGIMVAATLVFLLGPSLIGEAYVWVGVGILFLMGLQSALFSPSKYAILAELLPSNRIGWGNGYLQGLTFFAIVLGTIAGPGLFDWFEDALWIPGLLLVGLACAGYLTSRRMALTPPADPGQRFRLNALPMLKKYGSLIIAHRGLRWAILASTTWWTIGVLLQNSVIQIALNVLDLTPARAGLAILPVVIFQGIGCLIAARICRDGIRLWLIPAGAAAAFTTSLAVGLLTPLPGDLVAMRQDGGLPASFLFGIPLLIGLVGFSMAFFIVPVDAYVIRNSDERYRGGIWATANVLSSLGMVAGSALFPLFSIFRGHAADAFIGGGVLMLGAALFGLLFFPKTLLGRA